MPFACSFKMKTNHTVILTKCLFVYYIDAKKQCMHNYFKNISMYIFIFIVIVARHVTTVSPDAKQDKI